MPAHNPLPAAPAHRKIVRRRSGFSGLTLGMAVTFSLLIGYVIGREHMKQMVLKSIRQIVHEAAPHLSQEQLRSFTIVSREQLNDYESVLVRPVQ